ncbi:hypothetical protein [Lentzea jiangxiensis]|uniref:Uncharacterized protein n=1 Tax=Lentzea jiangxiensis TaxID=641025 RepID=A0A1H0TA85_9PSEU|nr:hypothetical protein [Lentzea jiangxiensis]SDP50952.1 hypothetical protein SAMN05421507_109214 [Lentzea jiangxiensis]
MESWSGGTVVSERSAFSTTEPTSWASDRVPFDSLMGVGTAERTLSLLGMPYLAEDWGHTRIALDHLGRR